MTSYFHRQFLKKKNLQRRCEDLKIPSEMYYQQLPTHYTCVLAVKHLYISGISEFSLLNRSKDTYGQVLVDASKSTIKGRLLLKSYVRSVMFIDYLSALQTLQGWRHLYRKIYIITQAHYDQNKFCNISVLTVLA